MDNPLREQLGKAAEQVASEAGLVQYQLMTGLAFGEAGGLNAARAVTIVYHNHRGETARRSIIPLGLRFAATGWHPQAQWLLEAYDVDKQAARSFAVADISVWLRPGDVLPDPVAMPAPASLHDASGGPDDAA